MLMTELKNIWQDKLLKDNISLKNIQLFLLNSSFSQNSLIYKTADIQT